MLAASLKSVDMLFGPAHNLPMEPIKPTDELRKLLSELGKKGGRARAKNLSSRRLREIAKKGARSRWRKKRKRVKR